MVRKIVMLSLALFLFQGHTAAQELLDDRNDDGTITILAFGDSQTYGTGDGTQPGAFVEEVPATDGTQGYPSRIRALTGIVVENLGVPGEQLTVEGVDRFPSVVLSSAADVVAILEGSNDAIQQVDSGTVRATLQRMINVARSLNKEVLLFTLPPPCCDRRDLALFTESYNRQIQSLATSNNIEIADLAHVWSTSCGDTFACELFNVPEGLHPNTRGYDAVGQAVLAAMAEIDVFAADGATELEDFYGLPTDSVVIVPDAGGET